MTDAPKRIWVATTLIGHGLVPDDQLPLDQGWTDVSTKPDGDLTPYVRADLLEAQAALIAEARVMLIRAAQNTAVAADDAEYQALCDYIAQFAQE